MPKLLANEAYGAPQHPEASDMGACGILYPVSEREVSSLKILTNCIMKLRMDGLHYALIAIVVLLAVYLGSSFGFVGFKEGFTGKTGCPTTGSPPHEKAASTSHCQSKECNRWYSGEECTFDELMYGRGKHGSGPPTVACVENITKKQCAAALKRWRDNGCPPGGCPSTVGFSAQKPWIW